MINPKDVMEKLTVEDLCLSADNYFKSISDPSHLLAKPFSSLIEAPELLRDMGHLLSELRLGKTMKVLEFGAGSCWFSRFLNQMQCQTISCDTSKTSLDIGKRLFAEFPIVGDFIAEPQFLHFDGHQINLPNESVDRIICFDAFHHIPNQEEVLRELFRVLKTGGVAGFCEPGKWHSQGAQSQYEMKNYKVLENDIDITDIFAMAKKCGFTDIKCKVLCDMGVTLKQYQTLTDRTIKSKLKNLLNSFLNQFNSDFSLLTNSIMDNVSRVMTNKTVFFLYKGEYVPDSRSHIGLSHSMTIERNNVATKAGHDLNLLLRITNTGPAKWLKENINGYGVVNIGTHLYDDMNILIDLNYSRHAIPEPIGPGESANVTIAVKFNHAGTFKLAIDLVSEGICWFENIGSTPQFITVKVS